MNTRETVLDMLLELEKGKAFSSVLVRSVLDKYDYLSAREKAFMKRLTEGTTERKLELDYILDQFSGTPAKKMKPFIRCLMRMSAYQILFMDAVPDSAACNEAVKLAGKRGFGGLKGFVNGVLRSLSRGKDRIVYPDADADPKAFLSVTYSVPDELAEILLEDYGWDDTRRMLESQKRIQPVSVRFHSALDKKARLGYIAEMEKLGVTVRTSPYLDNIYLLEHAEGISSLPGYEEGAFTVQDASSALAVKAAGIQPENFVIDICAAPGGKSLYAAELGARVLARDVSTEKLALMKENIDRMNSGGITLQEWDAACPDESLKEKADVVLMDVPCSGLGVMGKKRDIKYHVTGEGLERLSELQKRIVAGSWQYVKPGGILLYSTCTVRRAENEEMCDWICGHFPFEKESMAGFLPSDLAERAECGQLQLFPGKDECDGFFFARLRRKQAAVKGQEHMTDDGEKRY